MLNFRSKVFRNFFVYRLLLTLNFLLGSELSGHQLYLVTLNLMSKIFWNFLLTEGSALWIFQSGCLATNFFGHTKFEVKIFLEFFSLQSTLDSEFFRGGFQVPTFSGHTKFEVKNFFGIFFYLQSAVDSEFFAGGFWAPTSFGHPKFEVKNFLEFFVFIELFGLWIFYRECPVTNFFWSC